MYIISTEQIRTLEIKTKMFTPKYKIGVWLEPEEHAARKKEQKELQNIRKNEMDAKKIVHDVLNNIIENILKTKKEEELNKIRSTKYIRPKLRFHNGKRIQHT